MLAGAVAAIVLLVHTALLRDTVAQSTLDLLRLSLPPWNGATIALQVGLVAAHAATFGIIVLLLLAGTARWRLRRRWYGHIFTIGCWVLPLVVWNGLIRLDAAEQMPQMAAIAGGHRHRHLRAADPGALPPRLAGVPDDPAGARAGRAGGRLLPDDVPPRLAGEVAARRDAATPRSR